MAPGGVRARPGSCAEGGRVLKFAQPPPPPFYAVAFTFRLRDDADLQAYEAAGVELKALAEQRPDFYGEEAVRVDGGLSITISYWRDLEALADWRRHPRHAEIMARGVAEWYQSYELRVARVERVSSFEAPRCVPVGDLPQLPVAAGQLNADE